MISVLGLASEQSEYFKYLFKLSWPALSGLFIVFIFIGTRIFWAVKYSKDNKTYYRVRLTFRLLLSLVVMSIYIKMFLSSYGDWLEKPVVCRGIVESVEKDHYSNGLDLLNLRYGEEIIAVKIDSRIVTNLPKNSMIEINYLPLKKEVFKCTLLTLQAENFI